MGKARINSHLGGGLYDAVYWRDVEAARKRLEEADKRRQEITVDRYGPGGSVDKKNEASNALYNAQQNLLAAIDAWAACAKTNCGSEAALKAQVRELMKLKAQKRADFAGYAALDASLVAEEMALIKEIGRLQSTATDKEFEAMQIWAVDYPHEDFGPIPAGTVVGTAESYGAKGSEIGESDVELPAPHINILPSYEDEANYDEARDYQQRPFGAMTTSESLMNMLQFLYMANRSPSYCVGTLQSKDEQTDTATVTISGITPVGREPEGFEYQTLSNVPVVYQECHAKVFEPGDKVIVKFGGPEFASPTVIGFAENPKECKMLTLTYTSDPGGVIVGPTPQQVAKGKDGTMVVVEITGDGGFLRWSDKAEYGGMRRQDLNVQNNITANALITTEVINWPAQVQMYAYPYTLAAWSGLDWQGGTGSGKSGYTTTMTEMICGQPYVNGGLNWAVIAQEWRYAIGYFPIWFDVEDKWGDPPWTVLWQSPNIEQTTAVVNTGLGSFNTTFYGIGSYNNSVGEAYTFTCDNYTRTQMKGVFIEGEPMSSEAVLDLVGVPEFIEVKSTYGNSGVDSPVRTYQRVPGAYPSGAGLNIPYELV